MSYAFNPDPSGLPIKSEFAGDPDMGDLVELFLQELPGRMGAAARAWESGEMETVQRISHQLRGSSAGYGYAMLGTAAGAVEDLIRGSVPPLTARTPRLEVLFRTFEGFAARVMAGGVRKAA